MKLSNGPNVRTLIVAVVAVLLAFAAVSTVAAARELRVTTAADLLACADPVTNGPLTSGPDAGITATEGDVCVVSPGTYTVPSTVVVALRSLTIRSRNGSAVTVITGATPVFSIERDNVTIGGNAPDQGLTITGSGGAGIEIGGGGTPAGEADQDVTIQNNFITANGGDGITVLTPGAIETFRFEGNDFRGNGGDGIDFNPAVTSLGGSRPEEGLWITGNTFDSNGGNAILLGNTGGIENLTILRNEILRSGDSGIVFATTVTRVETVSIAENIIQQNGFPGPPTIGAGIAFLNTGNIEDIAIMDNRDATGDQGITGNFGPGILFDGAGTFPGLPVAGGGVTEIDRMVIEGNVITDNGGGGAGAVSLDGITFYNGGDISDLQLIENTLRLNGGNGVLLANGGDFTSSEVRDNLFRNNGTVSFFPSYGDGFAAVVNGDVSRITFTGNESRENRVRGVFLGSATGDVTEVRFLGDNRFNKNGLGLLAIPGTSGHGLELSSFGDISEVELDGITAEQNGGSGVSLDALGNAFAGYFLTPAPPYLGDINDITVTDGTFNMNGASAPVGAGNGLSITGDTVRTITAGRLEALTNDDHGVLVNSIEDIANVTVEDGEFSGNDRNHDSIGAGVFFDSTEDMDNVSVRNSMANDNQEGIHFAVKGGNGRALTVEDNTMEDNGAEGVLLDASEDLTNVDVLNNVLSGNAIGIRVTVTDRGTDITVQGNRITGTSGTGVLLNSTGVAITENDIRGQDVGIKVNKLEDNQIHQNNIVARHGRFGMDATGLGPSEVIDATENWWGEPSGPFHPTENPEGVGSEVSDKVLFDPWLKEPAVKTGAFFEVTDLGISPTSVNVGEQVTITTTIKNTGIEEGTQQVRLTITSADGSVVDQDAKTATLNKDATTTVTFKFTPTTDGTFNVKVEADTSKTGSFTARPTVQKTIEEAVAGHSGAADVIEDADILWAIELWVNDQTVPDTGQRISDAKILELIGLWVLGTSVSGAGAPVEAEQDSAAGGFFDWLLSFFAPRPAVIAVYHQASPQAVAPGGRFTVTVTAQINAGEVTGLLLAESLPAGWTVTPLENAGAYFKAAENKWLWLGLGPGTPSTISYQVTVPADAAPGIYTISGSYRTASSGEGEGAVAVEPLRIEVVGAPVELQVEKIAFTGSQFIVSGSGITGLEVQVYNLAGSLVFSGSDNGQALTLTLAAESPLANGVYLYTVTVRGTNGAAVRSEVRKLVILK